MRYINNDNNNLDLYHTIRGQKWTLLYIYFCQAYYNSVELADTQAGKQHTHIVIPVNSLARLVLP